MTYVIYRTDTGSATARQVVAIDSGTAADAAIQDMLTNQGWVETPGFVPDHNVGDTLRRTYTVNPATGVVTAGTAEMFSEAERLSFLAGRKANLLAAVAPRLSLAAKTGEAKSQEYIDYIAAVEALTEGAADPALPAAGGDDSLTLWQRIWRRGTALNAVSMVGGVPTGGLMHHESPAVGQNVYRFANGLMVQTRAVASATVASTSGPTEGLYLSDDAPYTYPAAIPAEGAVLGASIAVAANYQNGLLPPSVNPGATDWNVRWARLTTFSGGVAFPAFTLTLIARWI